MPNAFVQTCVQDEKDMAHVRIHGVLVDALVNIAPDVCEPCVMADKKGIKVLTVQCLNAVCGTMVASLLYQTVWVASATYLAWFWLIRHYPAPKLASFTFLTPLFGVFAGWLILDEPLTPALVVALVLVAMGVYLVNRVGKNMRISETNIENS